MPAGYSLRVVEAQPPDIRFLAHIDLERIKATDPDTNISSADLIPVWTERVTAGAPRTLVARVDARYLGLLVLTDPPECHVTARHEDEQRVVLGRLLEHAGVKTIEVPSLPAIQQLTIG